MQIDLAALPDDAATLQQMLREVAADAARQRAEAQEREAENDKLRLLIQKLLCHHFCRRSE